MKGRTEGIACWAAVLWMACFVFIALAGCKGKEALEPLEKASGSQTVSVEEKKVDQTDGVKSDKPRVRMKTSEGEVVLVLDRKLAPITVENFLQYAEDGGYNGTVFHRVIPAFMIQGGGFETGMKKKTTRNPIRNEADNGLKNLKGTIAMARTSVVDSATNQFFINCKDNAFLDHRGKDPRNYGYAVFGEVVEGTDVVERIEKTPTGSQGQFRDVPVEDVVIESVTVENP